MLSKTDETPLDGLLPFRWDLMGFGLSHAWTTGMLMQAARIPSASLGCQMAMHLSAVLTALVLAFVLRRPSIHLKRLVPFGIATLVALPCVGLTIWGSGTASTPLLLAGFTGAGACGAFFEIVWTVRFSTLPSSVIPLYILFVMALSSLLNIAIGFLPEWGTNTLSILLPLAAATLWTACPAATDPTAENLTLMGSTRPSMRSLTSLVLGCLVFSLTYNLFVTLVYESLPAETTSAVRFWANLLAALVLLVSFMLIRQVSIVGIFRFIMPITAAGFVLYLLAPQDLGKAALAVAGVGHKFFDILALVLVSRMVHEFNLPSYRWVGLLSLAKSSGYGLGLGLASATVAASSAQVTQAATALPVLILVLIACFVWLFPERTLQGLLEASDTRKSNEQPTPTLDDGVRRLAHEYRLTPREEEVLGLLARGRTEVVIMDRLAVSKGTAHTHVTHIYQKLGAHSQQEVIEMTERASFTDQKP